MNDIPEYIWEDFRRQEEIMKNEPQISESLIEELKREHEYFERNKEITAKYLEESLKAIKSMGQEAVAAAQLVNDFEKNNIVKNEIYNFTKNIASAYDNLMIESKNNEIFIRKAGDSKKKIKIEKSNNIILLNDITDGIKFDECVDFLEYLSEYPMLGAKHKIGKNIYNYIKESKKVEVNDITLFRVRKSSERKQIPYTKNEMFEPQYKTPRQNRFSMIGLNPLYVSDSLETAIDEVGIKEKDRFTYIKLILKDKLKLLNITNKKVALFDFCHKRNESIENNLSLEYLIPNFIADCAKEVGFDGIVYRSIFNESSRNYVFFDAGRRNFITEKPIGQNY